MTIQKGFIIASVVVFFVALFRVNLGLDLTILGLALFAAGHIN